MFTDGRKNIASAPRYAAVTAAFDAGPPTAAWCLSALVLVLDAGYVGNRNIKSIVFSPTKSILFLITFFRIRSITKLNEAPSAVGEPLWIFLRGRLSQPLIEPAAKLRFHCPQREQRRRIIGENLRETSRGTPVQITEKSAVVRIPLADDQIGAPQRFPKNGGHLPGR